MSERRIVTRAAAVGLAAAMLAGCAQEKQSSSHEFHSTQPHAVAQNARQETKAITGELKMTVGIYCRQLLRDYIKGEASELAPLAPGSFSSDQHRPRHALVAQQQAPGDELKTVTAFYDTAADKVPRAGDCFEIDVRLGRRKATTITIAKDVTNAEFIGQQSAMADSVVGTVGVVVDNRGDYLKELPKHVAITPAFLDENTNRVHYASTTDQNNLVETVLQYTNSS